MTNCLIFCKDSAVTLARSYETGKLSKHCTDHSDFNSGPTLIRNRLNFWNPQVEVSLIPQEEALKNLGIFTDTVRNTR